jgi:hypothetical protein
MAKATVDGTIPCSKCGNVITVENQRFTGGADGEREVYVKCLRCKVQTLIGLFRKYGNTLVEVTDNSRSASAEEYHEQPHIDPIFHGRWIGLRYIKGTQGKPGYEEIPIENRLYCTASADKVILHDGTELIVDKVTVGRIFDTADHQNLINFTNGDYYLILKLHDDRIGVCLEFDENQNPISRFEGRIAPAKAAGA